MCYEPSHISSSSGADEYLGLSSCPEGEHPSLHSFKMQQRKPRLDSCDLSVAEPPVTPGGTENNLS